MSKKTIKFEDIAEPLQDDRAIGIIWSKLITSLTPFIENMFEKLMEKFTAKIEERVEEMVGRLAKKAFSEMAETQNNKIASLEEECAHLSARIDEFEVNARLDNLVINGLPDPVTSASVVGGSTSQNRHSLIPELLDLFTIRLNLPLTRDDISFAYKIPKQGMAKSRPTIVGFSTRRVRDSVLSSRKILKESHQPGSIPVYINEHLTRSNSQLYAKARALVKSHKINSTWTSGGRVFFRRTESTTEKPTRVNSAIHLEELVPINTE